MIDYLVVGAGLSGATFAHFAARAGKRVVVIDRRPHIAGNAFTERIDGIDVHRYGPHIFHTNDRDVWEFITRFGTFLPYRHRGRSRVGGTLYPFPINLLTLNQVFRVTTPAEAEATLAAERVPIESPANLEEYALSRIGERLYRLFIHGYTTKQWGREPRDLPASILKRIPVKFTPDDAWFSDAYQGIPADGYTALVERMLDGIPLELGVDYHANPGRFRARKTVYTGPIDRFFEFAFGRLEYRSLRFEQRTLETPDFQGTAIVNHPDLDVPYTRVVEHKHFTGISSARTIVTWEHPVADPDAREPYYPVNDDRNAALYRRYREAADQRGDTIFLGRLARYSYFDMHQVIGAAMKTAQDEFGLRA
ncbi:MAG: UDP-galactopyranose mutase [Gemmataceae bacterium]